VKLLVLDFVIELGCWDFACSNAMMWVGLEWCGSKIGSTELSEILGWGWRFQIIVCRLYLRSEHAIIRLLDNLLRALDLK